MRLLSLTAFAVATCSVLSAQDYTLTDANVTYTQTLNPTVGAGTEVFRASSCSTDELFAQHWCFSVDGSGVGDTFSDADAHGAYAQASGGPNAMTQIYTDVKGLGLFDATWDDVVSSTGPEAGTLISSLTVTNTSASTITLKLYSFADVDFNNSCCGDFSLSGSNPERFRLSDNLPCGGCLDFEGPGADFYYADIWNLATGPNDQIMMGNDLPNTGIPFASSTAPLDFTGAFQWTVTLAPGRSETVVTSISAVRIGTPASVANVGVGSGGTIPTITGTAPRVGYDFSIDVANGTGATATLLIALDPAPVQVGVFGLQILASPPITTASVALTGGVGSLNLVAPCNPAFAGIALATQALVIDPGSPAAFTISASDILVSTIGD